MRRVAQAWACREPARAMSDCLNSFTNAAALEAMKVKWIADGKPRLVG